MALGDIVTRVGAASGKAIHGPEMATIIKVTAKDGYQVVLGLAETDPGTRSDQIILADRADGAPLKEGRPFRLVVGNLRPARSARMVERIEVIRLSDAKRPRPQNTSTRTRQMKMFRWIAALVAASDDHGGARRPVTVFAAASLKNALDEVGGRVRQSGGRGEFSYAASSAIARQIEQGAPAGRHVSADTDWMNYLAEPQLIVASSRRDLLTNRLALIAPADSRCAEGRQEHAHRQGAGRRRLAVAGPDMPAGKYAKASLTALGVWDGVSASWPRRRTSAPRSSTSRVARAAGIVYDTDARWSPR